MGGITLLHLSYDRIFEFQLRVPFHRIKSEDGTTKRICLAPTIEDAVNAKPGCATAIFSALKHELPLAFYTYKADISIEDLVLPQTLVEEYGVLDAELNQEYWTLSIPSFQEEIWMLDSAEFNTEPDLVYPRVVKVDAHRVESVSAFCVQSFLRYINQNLKIELETDTFLGTLDDLDEECRRNGHIEISKRIKQLVEEGRIK